MFHDKRTPHHHLYLCRENCDVATLLKTHGPVKYIVSGSSAHTNQIPSVVNSFPDAKAGISIINIFLIYIKICILFNVLSTYQSKQVNASNTNESGLMFNNNLRIKFSNPS